jgi:hypothetical protein
MNSPTKTPTRAIATTVFLFLLANHVFAQVQRQRIAVNGSISYGAVGVPKWSAEPNANNYGEGGDLILLSCQARPRERITVGAYLEYCNVDSDDKPVGSWKGVPASRIGREWGYRSEAMLSVGNWTRLTNPSQKDPPKTYTIQLFVPYGATSLAPGRYRFRYRIRVWADNRLVDDFPTNEGRVGVVQRSGQVREGTAICAAANGPAICNFRLQGTDDPDDLAPTPAPE